MAEVAVAGGGPVGLALAVTLARCGVAVTVFEQRSAPTPLEESRAITWMPGGLEFLDWLEITERFTAIGMRRHVHEFWSLRRHLVSVRYDRLDHRHPYTLMLPQHHTERLLQEAAEASGLVEIRRGHRVSGVGQDQTAAVVSVEGPDGQYTVPAAWAVGADGARSTVREALGVAQRWRDYGSDTAVADFDLSCDLPVDRSRIVLDPLRPYGFFPFAPVRWRLVYRINPGEDRGAMITETRATRMLAEFLPDAAPRELLWSSAFRLGQGQSRRYRSGRWLLVGDAAHSMGPSAGAGMMIGILGAWRLGLRLAEAITGGTEEPLNRYEIEQRAAAVVRRDRGGRRGVGRSHHQHSEPAQQDLARHRAGARPARPAVRRSLGVRGRAARCDGARTRARWTGSTVHDRRTTSQSQRRRMTPMSSVTGEGDGTFDGSAGPMTTSDQPVRSPTRNRWVDHHRFLAFVVLAYAISWGLWLIAAVGGGRVPFLLGALGPMAAAAIVTAWTGRSLLAWIRPVWRWRVPLRWWLYALGLPALLYAVVTLVLQLLGFPVDWSLAADRLPAYLSTFVFVLFLGGALEEPGWRGFGLPVLQERYSPLRATLILGLVWGVWHIPVYGPAGFVVPMVLAFFYTLLWNATRSVGLCILLHASFTPAQDLFILLPQEQAYTPSLDAPDWVILGTYVAAALLIVILTRGRLGHQGATGSGP